MTDRKKSTNHTADGLEAIDRCRPRVTEAEKDRLINSDAWAGRYAVDVSQLLKVIEYRDRTIRAVTGGV